MLLDYLNRVCDSVCERLYGRVCERLYERVCVLGSVNMLAAARALLGYLNRGY